MQKTSKLNNKYDSLLRITLENNSSVDKIIEVNIYDTRLFNNTLVFSKPYYVQALSSRIFYFPLVARQYNDFIEINSYKITYSPNETLVNLTAKRIYIDNINVN